MTVEITTSMTTMNATTTPVTTTPVLDAHTTTTTTTAAATGTATTTTPAPTGASARTASRTEASAANQTSEQFMLGLEERISLLGWLALVRACTLGQAARFRFGGDVGRARAVMENMIWQSRYIERVPKIKLPSGMGAAKGKHVSVYYLTEKGAARLGRIAPELARHARPGKPRGANLNRLPHELLVAETWLRTSERREILEFLPETELKRRLVRERMQRVRASRDTGEKGLLPLSVAPDTDEDALRAAVEDAISEAVGDARMRVRDRESGIEWTVETEVAVHYRVSEIKAKARGMDWFACDKRQSRMVELVTGIPALMLGDVTLPAGDEGANDVPTKEKGVPARVLRGLRQLGGAASGAAVQRVLGGYRSFLSRHLAKLERDGKLLSEATHLSVEGECGRPVKLYYLPTVELTSVRDVLERAAVSRAVTEIDHDWKVESYDAEAGVLTFHNDTDGGRVHCVIDRLGEGVEQTLARLGACRATHAAGEVCAIVVYEGERKRAMAEVLDDRQIWDVRDRLHELAAFRRVRVNQDSPTAPTGERAGARAGVRDWQSYTAN